MTMRRIICLCSAMVAAPTLGSPTSILPGTYTNAEQVNFAREAGTPVPPWTGVRIEPAEWGVAVQHVDAFGMALGAPERWVIDETPDRVTITMGRCTRDFAVVPAGLTIINQSSACTATGGPTTATAKGLALVAPGGTRLELQRARAFACEVALPRRDGKAEWWVKAGLPIHDAGGRLMVTSDEATPQRFSLELRNIAWPVNPADARLMLALHTDNREAPAAAALADPVATRIGVTLGDVETRCALVPPG